MKIPVKITEILKDSKYGLSLFESKIDELEKNIFIKTNKNKDSIPHIKCFVRGKDIRLTPEEIVRQLYVRVLHDDFGYPLERMELEYSVTFGREKKRADIVIFDKDKPTNPYIIIEVKKPKLKDGKDQLKSYCNATGSPMGIWTNGDKISFYNRKDPNYFEDIPNINNLSSTMLTCSWRSSTY